MASSDYEALRLCTPAELAHRFRTFPSPASKHLTVANQLLKAVHDEVIPPRVMTVYISVNQSPGIISLSLQSSSHAVRRAAFRLLGMKMRSASWETAWQAIGGTQGILRLTARSSVAEVKLLCDILGRSRVFNTSNENKVAITSLLQALVKRENGDHRPLLKYYAALLPACTTEFVDSILRDDSNRILEYARIVQLEERHPELFRSKFRGSDLEQSFVDVEAKWLNPLLHRIPPAPGLGSRFSASMDYSYELLQKCGFTKLHGNVKFYTDLAEPLLRRALKRRVPEARIVEILEHVVEYLRKHPNANESVIWTKGNWTSSPDRRSTLIQRVLRLWARAPTVYMHLLCAIIKLAPENILPSGSGWTSAHTPTIGYLLRFVSPYGNQRYDIMCLLLTKGDLGRAKSAKVEDILPACFFPELFFALPRSHARRLLERLIASRPAKDFFERTASIKDKPTRSSVHANVELLEIFLDRREEGAVERASTRIDARKKQAERSRDQAERAFYAKSTLFLTIASGSLQLLSDTLMWTRRYIRDSQTMSQLHTWDVMDFPLFLELISGVPAKHTLDDKLSLPSLNERIVASNAILLYMLETACMSLREPSFNRRDWRTFRNLFQDVVTRRFQATTRIQSCLNLSDEALYDAMWKPTVEMLLTVETTSLKEENKNLNWQTSLGPLKTPNRHECEVAPLTILRRFFQELAMQRDRLWQEHRRSKHLDVLDLPEPWPRGLEIQSLTGLDPITEYIPPIVVERAKQIVFMRKEFALVPVPETEDGMDAQTRASYSAIGPRMDKFTYALGVYVRHGDAAMDQLARTRSAWDYAMDQLTDDRMTRRESILFWRTVFERAGLEPPSQAQSDAWQPSLPFTEDASVPIEWNPAEGRPFVKSRSLQKTVLDCMLYEDRDLSSPLDVPAPSTVDGGRDSIFYCADKINHKVKPGAREAYITSSLLFLDGLKAGGQRLLSQAYPHTDNARYPALYLDDGFVSFVNAEEDEALNMLKKLLGEVPPTLLASAAKNALKVLANPAPPHKVEKICMNLLRLLAKSDRPELATDMILQVLFDRPDASSWHRLLLPRRFFNRLSPTQDETFLASFCDTIEARMQPSKSTEDDEKKSVPVKISTIKAFAQLLHGADYAPPLTSTQMLRRLFQKVNHIDVRTAILDDFLKMLEDTVDLREDILTAIEDVAPIAGGMNERQRVMTWQDWESIGKGDPLPEVSALIDDSNTPLLHRLLTALSHAEGAQKQELMNRVIVPVIKRSMFCQRQWLAAFLRQDQVLLLHGVDVLHLPEFSRMPVQPELLCSLIHNHLDVLPAEIDGVNMLQMYSDFVFANMNPSTLIMAVNQYILDEAPLRNSNAGQYMLTVYNSGLGAFNYNGSFHVVNLLKTPQNFTTSSAINMLKDFVFQVAQILLDHNDDTFGQWNAFIDAFEPKLRMTATGSGHEQRIETQLEIKSSPETERNTKVQRAWTENCRPVLIRIIDRIEQLRTPEWQRNPHRVPAVLPPTFAMRLWLLPQPCKDHMTIAARDVWQMLTIIVEKALYHEEFTILKSFVLKVVAEDRALLACQLAGLVDDLQDEIGNYDRIDLLAIDLADELLCGASKPMSLEQVSEVRFVLDRWLRSVDEGVRKKGLRLVRFLEAKHLQSFEMV